MFSCFFLCENNKKHLTFLCRESHSIYFDTNISRWSETNFLRPFFYSISLTLTDIINDIRNKHTFIIEVT